MLRADTRAKDPPRKRDVVRDVLAKLDKTDPEATLRDIVEAGVQGDDTPPAPGLRRCLVEGARVLAYCEKRQLRVEDGSVFLLKRERRARHVDAYVYALFFRLDRRRAELAPFDLPSEENQKELEPTDPNGRSGITLHTPARDLVLVIKKPGPTFRLALKSTNPTASPPGAGWTERPEGGWTRDVAIDQIDAAILSLLSGLPAWFEVGGAT